MASDATSTRSGCVLSLKRAACAFRVSGGSEP